MYRCERCDFFFHNSCAELPRYIHNSLHPKHPLVFYMFETDSDDECSFCKKIMRTFGYRCGRACCFNLHVECATESIFDPRDHEHAFRNWKPTLFTCDVCGGKENIECPSCICSICQLQVHVACRKIFPLSVNVRQRMHPRHALGLCYSFEIDFDFTDKFCKICSQKMNNVLCLYQCKDGCAYIAHASCASSKHLLMESIDHDETTGDCGHQGTLLDEDTHKEIETEQKVITHFSHPHSLTLSNIHPEDNDAVCYGCVKPIYVPFYTCDSEQCNFFLHKQCSELPKSIQRPIHQHPLVLKDFLDLNVSGILFHGFTCQACGDRCNGFVYVCTTCGETFDVGCSLFGDTLRHESHKCTLTLVSPPPNDENRCISCDSTFSTAFWCEECNFYLDLKCASLPITIGHDCPTGTVWSIKPLKLWYDCIEHAGGQYYCDLCGETRGKDLWFYYCGDCRDSIHPQCLIGEGKFMYGKSYNIKGHCHTVSVVRKPKVDPLCDTCGKPCENSPLVFWPTCNIYIHDDLNCCGMYNIDIPGYFYDSDDSDDDGEPIKYYCCDILSSPDEIKEENDEDDQETAINQVKHFSHPHNLMIGEYNPQIVYGEVCDGCRRVISIPDPYYTCADKKGKCSFFLHKDCFELPKQIEHPLHPDHPLILNSLLDAPWKERIGFICYGCDAFSNGFVYTCLACKFFLDVRCSLLSGTLVHESHQCTLTLVDKHMELAESTSGSKSERKCFVCNSNCCSCSYVCDECNFDLGIKCASLPKAIRHSCSEYDCKIRPKHLMYATIEVQDGSQEFYCDHCQRDGSRSENEWYYDCGDCGSSSHARCITVDTDLIKQGIAYKAYNHFHNLITVAISNSKFFPCAVCKERMNQSPAVRCKECGFFFHEKCCRQLRRV